MATIRTLADIEAIERVPLAERNLPPSTFEMLRRGAAIHPESVALNFFPAGNEYASPVKITFQQLIDRIHQTANLLHSLGVGARDTVSVILPNLPETHFALWGAEAAGVVNPVNPLLEPATIRDIMRAAESKVLITLGPVPGSDIWEKMAAIAADVPTLEAVVQVSATATCEGKKTVAYDKVIDRYNAAALVSGRAILPGDLAALFHTGGTTGTPKLAQQTHANQVFDAWALMELRGDQPQSVSLCGLPLFHVNAVLVTGLGPWSRGNSVVLAGVAGYRDPTVLENFYRIVAHYRVTSFSAVPTVYAALLNVPVGGADLSSLRYAVCGAAPMPPPVYRAFEERTGIRIREGYGLTEGTCVSSVNPIQGESRIGSIGFRFPYQEMKTVQLDSEGRYLRDCAPEEIGAVVIRGPNVFSGYKQPEHNRGIWVDDGTGAPWLNTGDLGRVDAEGYFWLTGRRKELIIRSGHNIDPASIESPLSRHPAVAVAAAVGRPDPALGEVPMAYVSLKPGARATPEELLDFARQNIGERAAVPKVIEIIDQIPLTAVGKIFKPRLRWRAIEAVFREELAALRDCAAQVTVTVGEEKTRGTLARIRLTRRPACDRAEIEKKVAELLGRYPIPYQLEIA